MKYVLCYTDIDECTVSNPCHEKATCNDTFGSFNCLCDPGFTGDGLNYIDIDECEVKIHDCHVNGTCENKEGTFKCHCGPWYQPIDGYNGRETRNCTLGTNINGQFTMTGCPSLIQPFDLFHILNFKFHLIHLIRQPIYKIRNDLCKV